MRAAWLACLVAAGAHAQQGDGVTAVPRPTGDDPKALAARVQALERRLDAVGSLAHGPEILSIDTIDRLATRLLAVEARMATVEEATGVRESRSHGHGDATFEVALALVLLDRVDFTASDDASLAQARRVELAVRAVAWPLGLAGKAQQLEAAWRDWTQAVAKKDAPRTASLAAGLAVLRRDLALAASNWASTMIAAGGGGHDHSGLSQGAHADHSPHHGGQVAMKGDTHLELVSESPGRWRVFLTDAFRRPLSAEGWSGALAISPDAPDEREAALTVDGDALLAVTSPAARRPIDLRVNLVAPEALAGALGPEAKATGERAFAVDFQFSDESAAGAGHAPPLHPPDCPMAPKD